MVIIISTTNHFLPPDIMSPQGIFWHPSTQSHMNSPLSLWLFVEINATNCFVISTEGALKRPMTYDDQYHPIPNQSSKLKQGNYSLRRPPKLIIPQAVIGQKWATVCGFMFNQTCTSKQSYTARVCFWMSSLCSLGDGIMSTAAFI